MLQIEEIAKKIWISSLRLFFGEIAQVFVLANMEKLLFRLFGSLKINEGWFLNLKHTIAVVLSIGVFPQSDQDIFFKIVGARFINSSFRNDIGEP